VLYSARAANVCVVRDAAGITAMYIFFTLFAWIKNVKNHLFNSSVKRDPVYDCDAWTSFLPVLGFDSFVRSSLCLPFSAALTSLYTSNAILSASTSLMRSLQR